VFRIAFWGILDSSLVSAANLVTTVLLARALSPADFGVFALLLGALFFAGNVQAGLITRPHNVLGATRRADEYRRYTASTALAQLVFTGASAVLVFGAALTVATVDRSVGGLLVAFVPVLVAGQLQEFGRRVLYTEGRLAAALANDAVSYGGQVAGMLLLAATGALTVAAALHVMAIASAAGALFAAVQLRRSLASIPHASAVRENWSSGRWLAGAEVAHWLGSGAYLYLAAAALGTPAAGALKVAQVFFGPLRILLQFLYSVVPREFARAYAERGGSALRGRVRVAHVLTIPLLVAYCLPVALLAKPLLEAVYGDKYSSAALVVALMAIQYFFGLLIPIVTSLLQVEQLSRDVFLSRAYATLLSLPCGWVLINALGVEGAVIGMVITAILINGYSWLAHRRRVLQERAPARSPA
jgi:O-antigen/teichoic acid export membrane protein